MVLFSNVLSKSLGLFLLVLHSQFAYEDSTVAATVLENLL